MTIKFNVDIKTVRKAFAIIDEDIPSDEIIESKLSEAVIDLSNSKDEDIKRAELGFVIAAIGQTFGIE